MAFTNTWTSSVFVKKKYFQCSQMLHYYLYCFDLMVNSKWNHTSGKTINVGKKQQQQKKKTSNLAGKGFSSLKLLRH